MCAFLEICVLCLEMCVLFVKCVCLSWNVCAYRETVFFKNVCAFLDEEGEYSKRFVYVCILLIVHM